MNLKKHRVSDSEVFAIYQSGDKYRVVFKDPELEPFEKDTYDEALAEAQRKANGDTCE